MSRSKQDDLLSRVNLQTVPLDEIVDCFDDESEDYGFELFGSVSIYTKSNHVGWENVIMLPQLIVRKGDNNKYTYFIYNGLVLPTKFNVSSYRDFYDEVSESTGKEIRDILYKNFKRHQRR